MEKHSLSLPRLPPRSRLQSGLPVAALLAALGLAAGCIKQSVQVLVRPDGSGDLVVSRAFLSSATTLADAYQGEMRRQSGTESSAAESQDPYFNAQELKIEARLYGRGVTYVRGQKISSGGAKGCVALFSFKDINEVRLPLSEQGLAMLSGMTMRMDEMPDEDDLSSMLDELKDEDSVTFSFAKGEHATLKIFMPPSLRDAAAEAAAAKAAKAAATPSPAAVATAVKSDDDAAQETDDEEVEAMGGRRGMRENMMRTLAGAHFSVTVDIAGQPLKNTSAHLAPGHDRRIVLLDADLDRMLAAPEAAAMDADALPIEGDLSRALPALFTLPGATVETNREVTVAFK